jgi:hypothetical protein
VTVACAHGHAELFVQFRKFVTQLLLSQVIEIAYQRVFHAVTIAQID